MSNVTLRGMSHDTLMKRTQAALTSFNGSPVTKQRRVRDFLTQQLGLTNEHSLHTVTQDNAPKSSAELDNKITKLFSAVEGSTLDYENEIEALRTIARYALQAGGDELLHKTVTEGIDPFEDDVDPEERVFTESSAMARFAMEVRGDTGEVSTYSIPVPMSVETDDGHINITLDAQSFFTQTLREGNIKETFNTLCGEGFAAGYAADRVFEFMADRNADAKDLLDYCLIATRHGKNIGHCATIDAEAASVWYDANVKKSK